MNRSFSVLLTFLFISVNTISLLINPVKSENKDKVAEATNQISVNYLDQIPSNEYILGEGDILFIKFLDERSDLDNYYQIDGSGTIYLPKINRVYVSGLTIPELSKILNERFKEFIINPNIGILIREYRPVRVVIDGEVNNPGIYILKNSDKEKVPNFQGAFKITNKKELNLSKFTRISDLLKVSGGVTLNADLENVEVFRKDNISNGGGYIKANINFLSSLYEIGASNNDIRLFDGDLIKIKKTQRPIEAQISKAIKSNINPKEIKVYVAGNVKAQGLISLLKNTTLNDAISASGGLQLLSGKVFFTRTNNGGKLDKRKFKLDMYSKAGEYKNPYLQNGDIIFVNSSLIGKSGDLVNKLVSPIVSSYGIYKMFNDD